MSSILNALGVTAAAVIAVLLLLWTLCWYVGVPLAIVLILGDVFNLWNVVGFV